ncbi:endolytic transglycosylase MltG [uncultured Caulobacter sp.]|uniref:endolytic transglycosylase MltG n=1 Tax=uncultured Caulobacter sp. TaxID=158749 RepID=UPI0026085B0D|nr:endolytic transglycosylase MltG [uncultured Caulobacter sp.]
MSKKPSPSRRPRAARRETASLGRRLFRALFGAALTLVVVGVVAVLGAAFVYNGPGPAAKDGDKTTVVLRKGASLPEIAASLQRGGVIRSSSVFMTAAKLTGAARGLKAGEYEFKSRASMAAVLDAIRHGRIVRHWITVPEGLTSDMVMDILNKSDVLTGSAATPPEGAILPETYEVQRGEDRAAVLQRMMDDRDKLLNQLWAHRQSGLPFNTKEEAVTLASIVEKETGKANERPHVASVFINRLRTGMRLGSDPTIIYGISRGRPLGRGIRLSELQRPTPYNTYLISGLPPTPIANPGRAALAAVLNPDKTDDLYFVADGTGGHVFAATLEQHNANVAKWRQIERDRAGAGAPVVPAPPAAKPLAGG